MSEFFGIEDAKGIPTQILVVGQPAFIGALILDANQEPEAKEGAPAVTVVVKRDSDGETVAEGSAVYHEEGIYVFPIEKQARVDKLIATWSTEDAEFTTYPEIVGARLCTLGQISEGITSSTAPTAAVLREARDIAEAILETECGVAFRPRYERQLLDGNGRTKMLLAWPKVIAVRSIELGEEALDVEDIVVHLGGIRRQGGWPIGAQNVSVAYEHGFASAPRHVSRICALLARHIATKRPSNMDDRATSYTTDEATYSLITPGVRGMVTAIPEVNQFVAAWHFPQVG